MAKYKRYWYIKANRKEWNKDKENSNIRNLDWALIVNHPDYEEGVYFDANKMIRDYFEQAQEGDIVILHSTHKQNTRYSKEDNIDKKFVPSPRIVGISTISKGLNDNNEDEIDAIDISVEFMSIFRKPVLVKNIDFENNDILRYAEPFKKGTNRFTLTELEEEQYEELKRIIIKENPDAEEDFEALEE